MSIPWTRRQRLEHFIETMDRPLLALAIFTTLLYLLDLKGILGSARPAYQVFAIAIDFVFLFDLVLKLRTFGKEYVRSPWALIDLLSCLPVLDVLANGVRPLRGIRFIRIFRILRILRTLRVLRALRAIPVFDQLVKEAPASAGNRRVHRNMNLAVITMTVVVLTLIVLARKRMEARYVDRVDSALRHGAPLGYFEALGGTTSPSAAENAFTRTLLVSGRPVTLYFSLDAVDERNNEIEFFLIIGMIITMLFFMYIMAYHQFDVSQTQLRALLNLALPRQVANRFVNDPGAYEKKYRTSASILFMDFVGFTQVCEALAHDPDCLSAHLERAMDRLVGELVRHDLIIDKFIGDAVMSFRGGPLVEGTLEEHAYRVVRASLDCIKALATLGDPYFHRVKIGGASSRDCLIGAFGTSIRLSYTILGDTVNVAARLEPASAQCGTQNLFCELTRNLCAERVDLVWRRWGRVRLEGRRLPIAVYEAFDGDDYEDWAFVDTFQRALEAFERGDFDLAFGLFQQADRERPGGDPPSREYLDWCDSLRLVPPDLGWTPVFETHK